MPPVESKLTYTKGRDIHAAGVVLLQMLLGRDIMEKYPDPQTVLRMSRSSILLIRKSTTSLSCSEPSRVPVREGSGHGVAD